MRQEVSVPRNQYPDVRGGAEPYYITYGSPASERQYSAFGDTFNEFMYRVLAVHVVDTPTDAKTTIFICNEAVANQINEEWQVKESRLIPLWERLLDLLDERPGVKIAYMPKSDLKARIREIKAEIIKREAEAAVDPDDSEYADNNGVCPW